MTHAQSPEQQRDLWTEVDRYISERLGMSDLALEAALADSTAAEMPAISVSPPQGRFLQLMASAMGARNVLEIGTLGGYSTICLARALPKGGRLITLEADPKHAAIASSNIARAGLLDLVDVRLGKALDTLPRLAAEGRGPFDFVFIDADKENIPAYFEWALKLSRRGALIVVDNVVRKGEVIDAGSDDPSVKGVRHFMDQLAADSRVSATVLQTVGSKGYDGFAIALVTGDGGA